jgi:hypothetical protein
MRRALRVPRFRDFVDFVTFTQRLYKQIVAKFF